MEGVPRRDNRLCPLRNAVAKVAVLLAAPLWISTTSCTGKDVRLPQTHASTSTLNATLGFSLKSVSLGGAMLQRTKFSGPNIDPDKPNGAQFLGSSTDGSKVQLRIEDAVSSLQTDVVHYDVSYSTDEGKSWKSLCGVLASGEKIRAIALEGIWDDSRGQDSSGSHVDEPNSFTFACRSSAIAACVDMGYRPWHNVTECSAAGVCKTISGQAIHQACTRMLRADYCGDGTSHTQDATPIDVFDGFGIQKASSARMTFEAEWTSTGARCIEQLRTDRNGSQSALNYVQATCPWRLASAQRAYDCGGTHSTMHTEKGFYVPLNTRSLLANSIR